MVVPAPTTGRARQRLADVLRTGRRYGITAVLLGPCDTGTTLHIDPDHRVLQHDTSDADTTNYRWRSHRELSCARHRPPNSPPCSPRRSPPPRRTGTGATRAQRPCPHREPASRRARSHPPSTRRQAQRTRRDGAAATGDTPGTGACIDQTPGTHRCHGTRHRAPRRR